MKIYKIKVNGKSYKVELEAMEEVNTVAPKVEAKKTEEKPKVTTGGAGNKVLSPIGGTVNAVKVNVGDKIKKGQCVAIVEAMKLENEVVSEFEGEVAEVLVTKGQNIASRDAIVVIK